MMNEQILFEQLRTRWVSGQHLITVPHMLPRTVQEHGSKIALIGPDRTLTYQQWHYYVLLYARTLREKGIGVGDNVMLYANNSCHFYTAYFALWHLGAVVIPLNVYLHEKEIAGIIDDSQPKLLLTLPEMHDTLVGAVEKSYYKQTPIHLLDDTLWQQPYSRSTYSQYVHDDHPAHTKLDDTAVLLYTSGTTGSPKGVMLSSRNVITNTLQGATRFAAVLGQHEDERFFSVLPLFHVFAQNACMWLPVLLGASIIIVPRIDRRSILNGLQHKPTMFFGFPALYGLLVMMKTAPLDSVKMFISGADALPDKIRMAFAMVYGRKICAGYGLTEASPVVAVNGDNADGPTNVVGKPVIGLKCEVRDTERIPVPPGYVGTLWIQGDNVMKGYYKSPRQTARVIVKGWLNTGDLALFDQDGRLAIVGREKDLIISKGFNIYPQEVENVLLAHPAVIKAAVVGKFDVDAGEIPLAFVALRPGVTATPQEILAFCKQRLAPYKVPRSVTCLDDLAMTATGKIDKKQLQQKL